MAVQTTTNLTLSWMRDVDKVALDSYRRHKPIYPTFVKVDEETKQHYRKYALIATLGTAPDIDEGGAIPFKRFTDGPTKTVYFTKIGQGMQSTEEELDDDQLGIMKQAGDEIGKSLAHTTELKAHDLLNSGFATGRLGIDSVALFSASHPMYGTVGVLQSNLITGALSRLAIQSAISRLKLLQNEWGIPVADAVAGPYLVWAHPNQEWLLEEIVKTQYQPETGNNAINPLYGKSVTYATSPYFTSTTAWGIIVPSMNPLMHTWRKRLSAYEAMDPNTGNSLWARTSRFLDTFAYWRGIMGSTGT